MVTAAGDSARFGGLGGKRGNQAYIESRIEDRFLRTLIPVLLRDVKEHSSIGRAPVSKTGGWGFESLCS